MADYTKLNLRSDVDDMAPKFGMGSDIEAHYARTPLGLANSGASYFKLAPDYRLPFGHTHAEQEELYWHRDYHINILGQQRVAEALVPLVEPLLAAD